MEDRLHFRMLSKIFVRATSATIPHIIQCDNEFNAGAFLVWSNLNGVRLIPVSAYTPTSNGKVERTNRESNKKENEGWIYTQQRFYLGA